MNRIYSRFGKTPAPPHLDERELRVNLGSGNTIFVGSSIDMFANEIKDEVLYKVFEKCRKHENKYLFQSKNPVRFDIFSMPKDCIVCTTLESNRDIISLSGGATVMSRVGGMWNAAYSGIKTMVTVEPVMDFDLPIFATYIRHCSPIQVNIGADTGNNHLPEPPPEKLRGLIAELEKFTKVYLKKNLGRLLK
jgi:hypothetical protein